MTNVRIAEVQVELRLAEAVPLDGDDAESERLAARAREFRQLEGPDAGPLAAMNTTARWPGLPSSMYGMTRPLCVSKVHLGADVVEPVLQRDRTWVAHSLGAGRVGDSFVTDAIFVRRGVRWNVRWGRQESPRAGSELQSDRRQLFGFVPVTRTAGMGIRYRLSAQR